MRRREFLAAGTVVPAAGALGLWPRIGLTQEPAWRVFEVTTRAEIISPSGVTRVWLPVPLTTDTGYQKSLGNTWNGEGGKVGYVQDPKYGAGIVSAEFPDGHPQPVLQVVSRFATRDRAVDFAKAGSVPPEDPRVLKLNLAATELIPTNGIVRTTAIPSGSRASIADVATPAATEISSCPGPSAAWTSPSACATSNGTGMAVAICLTTAPICLPMTDSCGPHMPMSLMYAVPGRPVASSIAEAGRMRASVVGTWVWLPITAATLPLKCHASACFSLVASACMSTTMMDVSLRTSATISGAS